MPTAFVARQGSSGPHVAFLCEYDALRGLGHACGHNLIATSSAGAGIALAQSLSGRGVAARVTIVGTPAEEGGGGKIPLCADGLFDDCDAVLIFHPSDRTASVQYALACTHWEWTFRGKAAHAAGNPDRGINALDAFVHAYNGISLWRQQLRDDARVHGFIIEGGTAPNIIPELTRGEYLTRARDGAYLREMNVRFKAIFEAAARATGCELQLDEKETYLDLRSNAVLAERASVHLAGVGLAEDRVVPWARTGSTDVGDVSYAAPTLASRVRDRRRGHRTAHARVSRCGALDSWRVSDAAGCRGARAHRRGCDPRLRRPPRACGMPLRRSQSAARRGPARELSAGASAQLDQ